MPRGYTLNGINLIKKGNSKKPGGIGDVKKRALSSSLKRIRIRARNLLNRHFLIFVYP